MNVAIWALGTSRAEEAPASRSYYNKTKHDMSSHGLRRRSAQRLLVDEGMSSRVTMTVGGWSSFAAIEPYLNSPSENAINDAFAEADLGLTRSVAISEHTDSGAC